MPDIQSVLNVTFQELSTDQQLVLIEAMDQFQHKCLLCFSKTRSGVPFLKSEMPRVLMLGESDATAVAEKREAYEVIQRSMEEIMAKHNTAFLNMFKQMMVSVFVPSMEKMLKRTLPQEPNGETGESSLLLMANQFKMQVLNRLNRVWVVSRSNSRTLIRQCRIHSHMERWHSAHLDFHLAPLTG
jgi:hypothetical protein